MGSTFEIGMHMNLLLAYIMHVTAEKILTFVNNKKKTTKRSS